MMRYYALESGWGQQHLRPRCCSGSVQHRCRFPSSESAPESRSWWWPSPVVA